jgi:hypothetical protein
MALGNNGNILQHFVELEAGQGLLSAGGTGGLRCVFTHAMAPFEAFEHALPENDPKTRVMSRALRMTERIRKGLDSKEGQPLLFQAFAELEVGPSHYPNSAVLMDWQAKQRSLGLRMAVAETKPDAQARLLEKWPGVEEDARVKVLSGNWRTLLKEGALQLRGPGAWPWLISLDPYAFDPATQGPAKDVASVDERGTSTEVSERHPRMGSKLRRTGERRLRRVPQGRLERPLRGALVEGRGPARRNRKRGEAVLRQDGLRSAAVNAPWGLNG